ncbi:hypothetical protein ABVC70_08195 [Hoylesella timonensis]|uniref:hypothetical protein n=1 Tax=Hoylesella timonensis TaxID=386414 RepID=UPI002430C594|nr:hypothetical protein [Hoylesella timonensis]
MKKNQVELKRYLAPRCEIIRLANEPSLLGSSDIRPKPIQVVDNKEEDEELEFE